MLKHNLDLLSQAIIMLKQPDLRKKKQKLLENLLDLKKKPFLIDF